MYKKQNCCPDFDLLTIFLEVIKRLVLTITLPLITLISCGNPATVSDSSSSEVTSSSSVTNGRAIDAFFAATKDDNGTITKDDGGVVYYYGEATMEYFPNGKQEGYITNGDAGIYDFTLDANGNVTLGQYYSDGTFYKDGLNLSLFTDYVGDTLSFEAIGDTGTDFELQLHSMLARCLYRFGDWSGTYFNYLSRMTMTLNQQSNSLMVYYVYQDPYTEEEVEHSYAIENVGSTNNAAVNAFLANPTGAVTRTSFSERFLSGEDGLFSAGRGTIPFPKDASVKFRDDGESNVAISDEILSLGFTDQNVDDYRASYAEQLLAAGFAYEKDEDGNTITYTSKDYSWKMTKIAVEQNGYIQESLCSVLMQYDGETREMYVGFTFWNQDLESADLTYPNALLDAWNKQNSSQTTAFFTFPVSDHIVATLIQGDLLHEHNCFFQLAFDSVEEARKYYNTYAEAAKAASWKQGTSTINQAISASSGETLEDLNYLYFYGPQDKAIVLNGMFCDNYGHAIISLNFDVGMIANSMLRSEGLTR